MNRKTKGFTLVELLVVIGIIALLISILLPSLANAREAASSIKCSANLRSLAQAVMIYGTDNKGSMVPVGAWGRNATAGATTPDPAKFGSPTLWESLKMPPRSMVRVCPTALNRLGYPAYSNAADNPEISTDKVYFSYRYNWIIGGAQAKGDPTITGTGSGTPGGTCTQMAGPPSGVVSTDQFFNIKPYRVVPDSSNVVMFVCAQQVSVGSTANNARINDAMLRPASPLYKTINGEQHQYGTEIAATHFKPVATGVYFSNGLPVTKGYTNVAYCDGSVRSVWVQGGQFQTSGETSGAGASSAWPNMYITAGYSRSKVEYSKFDPTIPW